jgi:hypothetical protein
LVAEYVRRHAGDEPSTPRWLIILHALFAAAPLIPSFAIAYLVVQHRLPWGTPTIISTVIALVVAVGIARALLGKLGLRVLYFVTLVPVVLSVAAILRIGAPAVDQTLSARPVARQLAGIEINVLPLAVLGVRRETEYGLAFYRNQRISRYELRQVPAEEHLLVIPAGARDVLPQFVGHRRVAHLGDFAPQRLEFYWVAPAQAGQ